MPTTTPPSGWSRPGPGVVVALGVIALLGLGLALVGLGATISDEPDQVTTGTASAISTTTGARAPATASEATTPTTTAAPSTTVAPTTTTPGRTGVFAPAPGQSAVVGTGPRKTYSVEVEEAVGLNLDPPMSCRALDGWG